MEKQEMKGDKIGEILLREGHITSVLLDIALKQQKSDKATQRLGEILLESGHLTKEQLLSALGKSLGLPVIDLVTYPLDKKAVEKIPKSIASKYLVIAVGIESNRLVVATDDPLNLYAVEDIRLVTNMDIRLVLADPLQIRNSIDINYSEIDARNAAFYASENMVRSNSLLEDLMAGEQDDQAPMIRLLNSLLIKGYTTNVSDIHLEPYEKEAVVRMRRDGMLLPYMNLSPMIHKGLVARTKILAQMDIAEKRKPQDGHFNVILDGMELNVRVSFIPTIYGEKGVLRLLTTNLGIDHSKTFGMTVKNYERMKRLLKHPHGIIYFTGPTGSGKTTTLYSILLVLSKEAMNLSTIEDPVERHLYGINQTQVNEAIGVTFEVGLKSLLRQDPDIIMVGETRDYETATISARAAMTGHLVFSTLHTNDAVSSVLRLKDIGLEPYMIAGSLIGIVAQRLVKKICPHCIEEYEASKEEKGILQVEEDLCSQTIWLKKGAGCRLCENTGYQGRIAIHEILETDELFRDKITRGANIYELKGYAKKYLKLDTLRQEAKQLVLDGITTIDEMQKITYSLD